MPNTERVLSIPIHRRQTAIAAILKTVIFRYTFGNEIKELFEPLRSPAATEINYPGKKKITQSNHLFNLAVYTNVETLIKSHKHF
ncbi:hypothetical protein LWM68_22510 [Niabella sp. W65]|nr:hypothetical protein [Niabella sp. W65]MCH7365288.1 hypothetical protein [Niabella sp. W65]ULT41082.1 hypothetical protein KRR40_41380 [Niabella sp. I65]